MEGLVVLCDLRDSRRVKDPAAMARTLKTTFAKINRVHSRWMHAPLETQKGIDEFGCVLKPKAPAGDILLQLWMGLHPHAVRTTIVAGTLLWVGTEKTLSVRQFTGPTFHEAADSLEETRRLGKLFGMPNSASSSARTAEHLGNMIYLTLLGWTPRQLEFFTHSLEGKTQAEIAELLSLSQPTISIALHRMQARLVAPILRDWAKSLPGFLNV